LEIREGQFRISAGIGVSGEVLFNSMFVNRKNPLGRLVIDTGKLAFLKLKIIHGFAPDQYNLNGFCSVPNPTEHKKKSIL